MYTVMHQFMNVYFFFKTTLRYCLSMFQIQTGSINVQITNIVASFRGMHVSPAKLSYVLLPRKCDYRTDGQRDAGQSDPYVLICLTSDTKRDI